MATRFDALRVIEAAYAPAPDDRAWVEGLLAGFAPLDLGEGLIVASLELEGWRFVRATLAATGVPRAELERMSAAWRGIPPEAVRAWFSPVPPVETLLRRTRRAPFAQDDPPLANARAAGHEDVLAVFGLDPRGHGVFVAAPARRAIRLSPRLAHRLTLVSAHLANARRLRTLGGVGADAVLDPSGAVQHAEGDARSPEARRSLAAAVLAGERARGRLRRSEPDEALSLWRGLVDGRWSLVDHVEAGGRRVVLARRNPPGLRDPRALSPRERDVIAYVAQGHGNRHIAYALGLSATTVATHLRRALVKLGVPTRREVIALFGSARGGR